MTNQIEQEHFLKPLFELLNETFVNPQGIYLDPNTSLFQTLEPISAEQASIPVGNKCASLAAQVAHIIFYLDVLERYVVNHDTSRVDWGEVWRTVEKVSPAEWDALRANLKQTYARIEQMLRANLTWNEDSIGGAMALVVHTAYHLGEIRQALCVLT
ncbi:MAG TPA: DinB family protein [Anaerolineales bacterium]